MSFLMVGFLQTRLKQKALVSVRWHHWPDGSAILTANEKNIISKAWKTATAFLWWAELAKPYQVKKLRKWTLSWCQSRRSWSGAHTSTTKFDPEVFGGWCSLTGDIHGIKVRLGMGHVLASTIRSLASPRYEVSLTTAEEAGTSINYCGKGGTDASATHLKNGGVPSATIGVCARYIHSPTKLYAMDDFLEAQAFLQALVKKVDRSTVDLTKLLSIGRRSGWQDKPRNFIRISTTMLVRAWVKI